MDDDRPEDWVAYRIVLLCADRRGRLPSNLRLIDRAVRVALFLDLLLRGRVWFDNNGGNLDTTPVGFAPADALLTWVQANPDKQVRWTFETAPVTAKDVLRAAVPQYSRSRHRRGIAALNSTAVEVERARLRAAADTSVPDTAETAVVVALAVTLNWAAVDNLAEVYRHCGPASGVVEDCCEYINEVMDKLALISITPDTSG